MKPRNNFLCTGVHSIYVKKYSTATTCNLLKSCNISLQLAQTMLGDEKNYLVLRMLKVLLYE